MFATKTEIGSNYTRIKISVLLKPNTFKIITEASLPNPAAVATFCGALPLKKFHSFYEEVQI